MDEQRTRKTVFTSSTGEDYSRLYRDAFNFHVQHYPPRRDLEYWELTAHDMGELAAAHGNNPLFNGLLQCIYVDLSREMPQKEQEQ